ncbi:MAG: hypothetical protein AB7N65_00665 [Vicinamibacterales bacterium]
MTAQPFIDALNEFGAVLAVKLYRMQLPQAPDVPVLPCLDHEAMLHEGIAPHTAAYVKDANGDLHEAVFVPDAQRIDVEVASTIGECTSDSQVQFIGELRRRFPAYTVRLMRPSRLRGERRVMNACRAHVSLRDVLVGDNLDRTKSAVDRLQLISSLMEKQSRSASWATRTVMTPLVAVAGFLTYEILGTMAGSLSDAVISAIRYAVITVVGGIFLYYGVKAVQLTEMANRVWKRSAEYSLILNERRKRHG